MPIARQRPATTASQGHASHTERVTSPHSSLMTGGAGWVSGGVSLVSVFLGPSARTKQPRPSSTSSAAPTTRRPWHTEAREWEAHLALLVCRPPQPSSQTALVCFRSSPRLFPRSRLL